MVGESESWGYSQPQTSQQLETLKVRYQVHHKDKRVIKHLTNRLSDRIGESYYVNL